MSLKPFSECRYSAFFSYAHADDEAWNYFVTNFCEELEKGMASVLAGIRVPKVHLSSENGPINGPLDDALRRNIEDSFAMVVFVHEAYLRSEWCLQEIRHFKALFGEGGFRERLYIIAMSRPAMERLTAQPSWRELFPDGDQVWMPFFQDDDDEQPMTVYAASTRKKKLIVSNEFWEQFVRFRTALAKTIKTSSEAAQRVQTYPAASAGEPVTGDPGTVRVYIESNVEQNRFWEPLGEQIARSWDRLMVQERDEPPLRLRPTGLPMNQLDSRPLLDDANGVVLLWGKKTPDSLAAQISRVEPRLSGPHFAPGIIAYLMEDAQDQPPHASLNHWRVVRFWTREDGSAGVLPDDERDLARFLEDVLRHKRRS